MKLSKKFKLFVVILTVITVVISSLGVAAPRAIAQATNYAAEEVELAFDPVAALAVQERLDQDSSNDLTMFGDLGLVLHTLGDPMGAVGFEGDYALPSDSNALVEIMVQFHTPPAIVLELMSDADYPDMMALSGQNLTYGELALVAHATFEEELETLAFTNDRTAGDIGIIDIEYIVFNGALMVVPAGEVENIAALPEVFMVTPNFTVYTQDENLSNEDFWEDLQEVFGSLEEYDEYLQDDSLEEYQEYVQDDLLEEDEGYEEFGAFFQADLADWVPGSNSWSRNFMQEPFEWFNLNHVHNTLGIRGQGVRAIILDSGLEYLHPRYHRYWYTNQRMQTGELGSRVPGSGGSAGVINPEVPPTAGNLASSLPGAANVANTPQEAIWNGGWGDGGNHGTHVAGSVVGMAPDVILYAYRGTGTGVWGIVGSFGRMWIDGHSVWHGAGHEDNVKYYTRNVVNISLGNAVPASMNANTYSTNVITLTGYYLIFGSAGNSGVDFYTITPPGDSNLMVTVGAGRGASWLSPYIFENATINGVPVSVNMMAWDWAWMPRDENGWLEAFPANMGEILRDDVFGRPIRTNAEMNAAQVPRWQRGNGLRLDANGNVPFIWVGALADTVAAREAAFARLETLGIDISGAVIIQARNAAGSPGQNNPRDFWAQRGAGAFLIVCDRPSGTTHSYAGGTGVIDKVQGSIPMLSISRNDGRATLPFPAGFPPQATISDSPDGSGTIPITTNAATAAQNIQLGAVGTINLGQLTDHSVRDVEGNFISQGVRAPNYLATFSSVGPLRHTYNIGIDLVGPGAMVQSTHPAQSTNRWLRALRNAEGDFVTATGEVIDWATGNPVRDPMWFNNPATHRDWSTAYAIAMGTSMSSPTVAGIGALVWSAFPDATPYEVKARLMNTSVRMGSQERGLPYNVFQEGAGFVNPEKAVTQQAFATVDVGMHWHFVDTQDPNLAGRPGGPIVGGNIPGGWQSTMISVRQSALNFGAVYGTTSHELTVTIHNAGTQFWAHEVNFITNDPAVNQRPVGAFHPDVRLRLVERATNSAENTQTLTFVMEFPEDVPHGFYNGHVVFFNAAGGRITMPFMGAPYHAEGTVSLREGTGLLNPIISGFVLENEGQMDPRHIPSSTVGELTDSNRSSIQFNFDAPQSNVSGNWYTRVDVYARRVNLETGELGDKAYVFGTANQNFGQAGLLTGRRWIANRVNDPNAPGEFIYLEEGVYELFIDFNLEPPEVVDMQVVPGKAIPLSVGRFVVTNTLPATVIESISPAGENTVNVSGRISSWAHEMAIQHNMFTIGGQNEAGNFVTVPATPVAFEHAEFLVNGEPAQTDAFGNFTLSGVPFGTSLSVVEGMLFEYAGPTGAAVSLVGANRSIPFEIADRSLLRLAITVANNLNRQDFTPASWEVLERVLADAQRVYGNLNATRGEVDRAVPALLTAIANLVTLPAVVDRRELEMAAVAAEARNEINYTSESWDRLQDALEEARRILADPNATQDQIDAALAMLNAAKAELTPSSIPLWRMFHPGINQHLWTTCENEYQVLATRGWDQEGIAWYTPRTGRPVHRLFHEGITRHHYTADQNEIRVLVERGWNDEGVLFYCASPHVGPDEGIRMTRLFHEGALKHLHTADANEVRVLTTQHGWNNEGESFVGLPN